MTGVKSGVRFLTWVPRSCWRQDSLYSEKGYEGLNRPIACHDSGGLIIWFLLEQISNLGSWDFRSGDRFLISHNFMGQEFYQGFTGQFSLWAEVTLSDTHLVARLSLCLGRLQSRVWCPAGRGCRPGSAASSSLSTLGASLWTLRLGSHSWHGSLVFVRPVQKLLVLFLFFFFFNLLLNILDLQCCVEFFCTAKWHNYTYMHSFSYCFSIVVCHRMLNILVLCVIQYDLVVYPSYI